MATFLSSQQLWTLLNRTLEKDDEKENVEMKLFDVNIFRKFLLENISYFKPRKQEILENEKKKLKQCNLVDDVISFVDELSEKLGVCLIQTYDLLFCFFLIEYSGGKRQLRLLVNDKQTKQMLMNSVEKFYYQEMLHIVKCLTFLVKHSVTNYGKESFLEEFLTDRIFSISFASSVLRNLLKLYENFDISKSLENKSRAKCKQLALHYAAVKEEVLKFLIWSLHMFEFSVELAVDIVEQLIILENNHNSTAQKLFNTEDMYTLNDRNQCLLFLLATKIFDIECLQMCYQNEIVDNGRANSEKSLWFVQRNASEMDEALSTLAKNFNYRFLGAFYLCRCFNLQLRKSLIKSSDDLEGNLRKYSSLSLQHNGLSSCLHCLNSPCVSSDRELFVLASSVIYVMLDGCLHFFEANSLGESESLFELLKLILRNENVADEFWSSSMLSGIYQYVREEIFYRIPYSFQNALPIITALCQASSKSCLKALTYFEQFSCFTEHISVAEENSIVLVDGNLYKTVIDRIPYQTGQLVISAGSVGQLIENVDEHFLEIRWRIYVNVWQLIFIELHDDHQGYRFKWKFTYQLLDAVLKCQPNSASSFIQYLNDAIICLKNYEIQDDSDIDVLSLYLSCFSSLALIYPEEIFLKLHTANIFPVAEIETLSWTSSESGLVVNFLNTYELPSQKFPFTVAFLELLFNLVHSESMLDNETLTSSVGFVLENIFPHYQTWSYVNYKTKDTIGYMCLKIFLKCVENLLFTTSQEIDANKKNKLPSVSKLTVDLLLFGEARHTLLKIVSVGPDALREVLRLHDDKTESIRICEMVSMCVSLISHLFDIASKFHKNFLSSTKKNVAPLFTSLFLQSGSNKTDNFITVLGKYLIFNPYDRLPRLSLICLTKIAELKSKRKNIWPVIKTTGTFYQSCIRMASNKFPNSANWANIGEELGQIIENLVEIPYENFLAPLCLSPFYASVVILSEGKRKFVEKRGFVESIFFSLCTILNKLIDQRNQSVDETSRKLLKKAILLNLNCICASIDRVDQRIWLTNLKKHCVLSNVAVSLSHLSYPLDLDLFAGVVNCFTIVSHYEEALNSIRLSGFCDFVCTKLPSEYSLSLLSDEKVFGSLIYFYAWTLSKIGYRFAEDALTFFISWEEVFVNVFLTAFDHQQTEQRIICLQRMFTFLLHFSNFKDVWLAKSLRTANIVLELVSKTYMRLIAYLSKPTYIKELVSKNLNEKDSLPSTMSSSTVNMQKRFFKMCVSCSQILLKFSPDLSDIICSSTFDADAYKPLCTLDFATNLSPDVESLLSFGGLLLICQLCVTTIRKMDGVKITSPLIQRSPTAPLAVQIEKNKLVLLFESSVSLCLCQGFLRVVQSQNIDSGESDWVKRDLSTELDLLLSKCGRSVSSPSTPRKSPIPATTVFLAGGASTTSFDQDFVKLARECIQAFFTG